jgi:hypothetical protein
MITTALSRAGAAGSAAAGAGNGSGASGNDLGHASRVQRVLEEVSQGFHDVVDAVPDVVTDADGGSALKDARLMTQIGMVFGLVYVGFLTVWFWATRRRREEGI